VAVLICSEVLNSETGRPVGQEVLTPGNELDFQHSNVLFVRRKFLSVIHSCGQRMEVDWAKESSAIESRISAHVQYDSQTVQPFRSANIERLTLTYEAQH